MGLTSKGEVFTWGSGAKGQVLHCFYHCVFLLFIFSIALFVISKLGHGDFENQYYPKLIDFLVAERVQATQLGNTATLPVNNTDNHDTIH